MTKVIEAIEQAVRGAKDAARREHEERSSVKQASSQPRTDLARGLRTLASALRMDGGSP
jgi:hypothetical protein